MYGLAGRLIILFAAYNSIPTAAQRTCVGTLRADAAVRAPHAETLATDSAVMSSKIDIIIIIIIS